MERFIKRNASLFNIADIEDRKNCHLDLKQLTGDHEFIREWITFFQDLTDNPDHTLNCLSLALHQVFKVFILF